ncbi:MAG: ATP-binding cassette domain-containing protein, partial [Candidatus Rokuibacteriota bacterium]
MKDLSFTVGEDEIVGLIGPNGAGKTTAFALISGFLVPDAGEVTLRGRSLRGLRPHEVNALGLARTFQIMRPFPRLSVLRNVMIGT